MHGPIKIFCGRSNKKLGKKICENLNLEEGKAEIYDFPDGETYFHILENVRGKDIFVIQSCSYPQDKNIMELLIMIDALKRASAQRITAVIPYFPYARQDRKDRPRVPITAKLITDLIEVAGSDRVLTMDLHVPQIQGFFKIPLDHLYAMPVFVEKIKEIKKELGDENLCVVSPDIGGVHRTKLVADRVNASIVITNKVRSYLKDDKEKVKVEDVIGDVENKNCIIIDDIVDGGSSLCKCAEMLNLRGAKKIFAFCTHPILSGDAVKKINESKIEKLYVTDTIAISEEKQKEIEKANKIEVLSVAKLFAEAIRRIHEDDSISILFD